MLAVQQVCDTWSVEVRRAGRHGLKKVGAWRRERASDDGIQKTSIVDIDYVLK